MAYGKPRKYSNSDNVIKLYEDGRKTFEFHDNNVERLIKNSYSTIKKKFGLW